MTSAEWRRLAALQEGVVSRAQLLDAGLDRNDVRRLLRRRELHARHPGVYALHAGTPTWAALLRDRGWRGRVAPCRPGCAAPAA